MIKCFGILLQQRQQLVMNVQNISTTDMNTVLTQIYDVKPLGNRYMTDS